MKICDRNVLKMLDEVIKICEKMISPDVKANLKQNEIKELIVAYLITSINFEINIKSAILRESLGTNWKFRKCCRMHKQSWWLCWKKAKFFIKIKSGRATLVKERIYKCYISWISLVAFENFEWLLMTSAVIYNNCNFTKQY